MSTSYQGFTDRTTWSAALWLANDYGFYSFTKSLLHNGVNDWDEVSKLLTIQFGNSCNPDGMSWAKANRDEMNEVLADLV